MFLLKAANKYFTVAAGQILNEHESSATGLESTERFALLIHLNLQSFFFAFWLLFLCFNILFS